MQRGEVVLQVPIEQILYDANTRREVPVETPPKKEPAAIAFVVCVLSIGVVEGVLDIVYAAQGFHDVCQKEDPSGLTLAEWLLGRGIAALLVVVCMSIPMFTAVCMDDPPKEDITVCAMFAVIMVSLFGLIYFIVGLVVVIRSSQDCVNQGTSAAVMTIVELSFTGLYFVLMLCTPPKM